MNNRLQISVMTAGLLTAYGVYGAELTVNGMSMLPVEIKSIVVSGSISGEQTIGVSIVLEITPRPGTTGKVQFTPAPPTDITQAGDPWPGTGVFTPLDTNQVLSPWRNASVDDNGTYLYAAATYSGPLTAFPVEASYDASGVWDVSLTLTSPNQPSNWEGVPTTLYNGTISICRPTAAPLTDASGVEMNRYLSLEPRNAGRLTALRVTLTDLPSAFASFEGTTMWVGTPQRYCENSGQSIAPQPGNPPSYGCGAAPGIPSKSFMAASLLCSPSFVDWSTYLVAGEPLYIFDDEIVPDATYNVQAIHELCDAQDETHYSSGLTLTTPIWGDVVLTCTSCPCGPPNGLVDYLNDVISVLNKFSNANCAPIKGRADVDPDLVSRIVDIIDVNQVVSAYQGGSYPFDGPSGCP